MAFPSIDQTRPDFAIYRPWAWLELGSENIIINDPQGEDEKFRWLKSFSFSVGVNRGAAVEFIIFDNRGDMKQIWLDIIRRVITSQGEVPVRFQFGWSGRDRDGARSP